jgi:glycosyltransferase involved in cell wall biosynthesis
MFRIVAVRLQPAGPATHFRNGSNCLLGLLDRILWNEAGAGTLPAESGGCSREASMLVSVAVPFWNAAGTLGEALRSVFAQTWTRWELILLDDGSTDGSLQCARKILDPRVRVLSDGRHRGLSYRLNQSAGLARGEYLARMDADDLMHPERIFRQVEYLEAHPETDVVGTSAYIMDWRGELIGKRQVPVEVSPASVLAHGLFIHPTVMGRIQWFRENPYDERRVRAEDHDLWCRTLSSSRFGHIPELLFFYREGETATLQKYSGSSQTDRVIFRAYGPDMVGGWETRKLIARSMAKVGIFCLFHRLGLEHRLIARRNKPLTAREYQEGQRVLREIRSPDPGLDYQLVTVQHDRHAE